MKTYTIKATEAVFRSHGNVVRLDDLGLRFYREQRKGGEVVTKGIAEGVAELSDDLVTWLRTDGYEVTEYVAPEEKAPEPKKKGERSAGASS